MFGAVKILVVLLQISYIRGQLDVNFNDGIEDIDAWDDDSINYFPLYVEAHIECVKYEVIIDERKVPCEKYVEIIRKEPREVSKIKKRDLNELEGSGDIPIEPENQAESQPKNEETIEKQTTEKIVESTTTKPERYSTTFTTEYPSFTTTQMPTTNVDITTEKIVEASTTQILSTTQKPSEEILKEGKKGRRLPAATPKDLTEENTEKESIDEHQSGNAVMDVKEADKKQNLEGIVETENTLRKAETNSENSSLPDTGESSADIKKGATKDTTILFLLFGAVLVVFAIGFVYSFIKRKKETKQQKRIANDVNIIRKSLQSLTIQQNGSKAEDIESGTEMKPLMKIPEEPKVSTEGEK